jgi:hypothetical protein
MPSRLELHSHDRQHSFETFSSVPRLPPVTSKRPQSHALSISTALYRIQGASLPSVSLEGLPALWQAGYGALRKVASFNALSLVPYALRLALNIDAGLRRVLYRALSNNRKR